MKRIGKYFVSGVKGKKRRSKIAVTCVWKQVEWQGVRNALLLLLFCGSLFGTVFVSYSKTMQIGRKLSYGAWDGAVFGTDKQEIDKLRSHAMVKEVCVLSEIGELSVNGIECGKIGAVEAGFYRMGNLRLIDGKYPEHSFEAVVETDTLSKDGTSYNVGDTLDGTVVYESPDGKKKQLSVRLRICGVLKPYRRAWKFEKKQLPAFLLSSQSDVYSSTVRECSAFFSSRYENKHDMEELKQLFAQDRKTHFETNYAIRHKAEEDGNGSFFHKSSIPFGILFLFAFVGFAFWSGNTERMRRFELLKTMGVSDAGIRLFFFKEANQIFFASAILSVGGSFLVSQLLYRIYGRLVSERIYHTFSWTWQCALCLSVYGVLVFWEAVFFWRRSISIREEYQKKGKDGLCPRISIIGRELYARRKRLLFLTLCQSLFYLLSLVLFFHVYEAYRKEVWMEDGCKVDYLWTAAEKGIDEDLILQLAGKKGVSQIVASRSTGSYGEERISLSEETLNGSAYRKAGDFFNDMAQGMAVSLVVLWNEEEAIPYYMKQKGEWSEFDLDEFLAGKQVICYLPDIEKQADGTIMPRNNCGVNEMKRSSEKVIHAPEIAGKTGKLTVREKSREIKVGGVLRGYSSHLQEFHDIFSQGSVIVSQKFMRDFLGGAYRGDYDQVQIAVAAKTDKEIAQILSVIPLQDEISFTDYRSLRAEAEKNTRECIFFGGLAFVPVLLAAVFTVLSGKRWELEQNRERVEVFQLFGMSEMKIRAICHWSDAVCVLLAAAVGQCFGAALLLARLYRTGERMAMAYRMQMYRFPYEIFFAYSLLYLAVLLGAQSLSRIELSENAG